MFAPKLPIFIQIFIFTFTHMEKQPTNKKQTAYKMLKEKLGKQNKNQPGQKPNSTFEQRLNLTKK